MTTLTSHLQTACQSYSDSRLHHCQLSLASCEGQICVLTGSVLDQATLDGVLHHLAQVLPQITFRTDQVRVLRQEPPRRAVVTTSVAGVHAQPSFSSELVTQVMAGWSLEILDEAEGWVYTRQEDGYLGWIYAPYLTEPADEPATHLVLAPILPVLERPEPQAPLLTRLSAGARVTVLGRRDDWRLVRWPSRRMGWVPKTALRQLDEDLEDMGALALRLVEDALTFMGVPYRWGGSTGFGIDCSGFVRLLYLLNHRFLPRDADMQFRATAEVKPPFQPGHLLFFKSEGSQRVVTHVGMSLGGWKMIHASISRNGVAIDDVQKESHLKSTFVAARAVEGIS